MLFLNVTGDTAGKIAIAGAFTGGDVAFVHDYLVIAAGAPRSVSLYRAEGATTSSSITSAAGVSTSGSIGSVSLDAFDGARIVIAAARQRVALAWLDAPSSPTPGGWALLSCEQ